jgi:bifunctional DNase/RNase
MGNAALIEVSVVKVAPFLREDRPLLWLCEKHAAHPRLLPIAIGEFEAAAIQMPLDGEDPVRPISYDLLCAMLAKLQVAVRQVVIHSARRSTYYAKVVADWQHTLKDIDARPSDAVALALRLGSPIFVAAELLDRVALVPAPDDVDVEQTLKRFMEAEPQIQGGQTGSAAAVSPSSAEAARTTASSPALPKRPGSEGPVDELAQLQSRLERAVVCEEYEEAARLRDEIESRVNGDRG